MKFCSYKLWMAPTVQADLWYIQTWWIDGKRSEEEVTWSLGMVGSTAFPNLVKYFSSSLASVPDLTLFYRSYAPGQGTWNQLQFLEEAAKVPGDWDGWQCRIGWAHDKRRWMLYAALTIRLKRWRHTMIEVSNFCIWLAIFWLFFSKWPKTQTSSMDHSESLHVAGIGIFYVKWYSKSPGTVLGAG